MSTLRIGKRDQGGQAQEQVRHQTGHRCEDCKRYFVECDGFEGVITRL